MFADEQVRKGKILAIICYILPVLFFVPLLFKSTKTEYGKFHANQALLILLIDVLAAVFYLTILLPVVLGLTSIVLVVLGIISAKNGSNQPLPMIGSIHLIKT